VLNSIIITNSPTLCWSNYTVNLKTAYTEFQLQRVSTLLPRLRDS